MENKCEKCYENDKTPDENDCKKCQKVIIDGVDVSGCEFQSNCIEYKDISYLKVMPICAIHELSIACHDKVNKCKYYKVYTQLKRLEAENAKLKEALEEIRMIMQDIIKDNGRHNLSEYSSPIRIEKIVNEVLKDE